MSARLTREQREARRVWEAEERERAYHEDTGRLARRGMRRADKRRAANIRGVIVQPMVAKERASDPERTGS